MTMTDYEKAKIIRNNTSQLGLVIQLAEEANELGHAACKLARILKGSSPTPVKYGDAMTNLIEEYNDVILTALILGDMYDKKIFCEKLDRWCERIGDKNGYRDKQY